MICEGNNAKKINEKRNNGHVYTRHDLQGDTLYYIFRFREFNISFSKKNGSICRCEDQFASYLVKQALVSHNKQRIYVKKIADFFQGEAKQQIEYYAIEKVYDMLHQIRLDTFGIEVIEDAKEMLIKEHVTFTPENGIDQRSILDEIGKQMDSAIFVLTEPCLLHVMKQEIEKLQSAGKTIYVVASAEKGYPMLHYGSISRWLNEIDDVIYLQADRNGYELPENLQQDVYNKHTCLFYFGEEGVITCRDLPMDSFVYATPRGFHAQAVTGQLGIVRDCVVYIPAGFDITPYVPIIDKTRLDYSILYALWKQYGLTIYSMTVEELYLKYPEAFVNIYDKQSMFKKDSLIKIKYDKEEKDVLVNFDHAKETGIQQYLHRFKNLEYISTYFDKDLNQTEPIITMPQNGIHVHAVRVKNMKSARVIPCKKKQLLREQFAEMNLQETGIASNFLFFMTEKLMNLYNSLRQDRPEEMSKDIAGYLDYKLEYCDDKRIETFPLFQKTCIAMQKTGKVFLFNYRLGGGKVELGDVPLCWSKEDVDIAEQNIKSPICVYTPYFSLQDRHESQKTYRRLVGENRLNFVIYQDKIICCRMGDVVLSSVGVVLSIEKEKGLELIDKLKLSPKENGYYNVTGLSLSVHLDTPDGISQDDWDDVKWAYGGGLTLIDNGQSFCDTKRFAERLEWEGWTTPLSRQTQESAIHKVEKHPRTAVGTTKEGDLIILVFSGRTNYSCGACYSEMCEIAKQLFPDIQYLMNVDGGASTVLGLVHKGEFLELNVPATSNESTVGMVRNINTVLYVTLDKEEQKRGESHD